MVVDIIDMKTVISLFHQSNLNQKMKTSNMTTLHLGKSIGHSPWRRGCLLFALAWFALSPAVRAVSPPPDGGYADGNTAEGTDALFSLTTGIDNTATGLAAPGSAGQP